MGTRRLSLHHTPFLAIAAGILVVATACSSSSSGGGGKGGGGTTKGATSTTEGQYGTLPAEHGTPINGGTVTIEVEAGSQPNYIFPVTPGADQSVYTSNEFQNLMFRPLYWFNVGNRPVPNDDLSLAQRPVFSNGDKTATINLKPNYKWSDGKPVTSQDVLFFIDELRAAVKENPANYGNYTPGAFPDNVTSATAPSPTQVVLNFDKAYNPNWMFETQLNLISPLPSTAWNKASENGPSLDFSVAANAKKIYDFLDKQSKKLSTYATNPLWQDVDGPFKLSEFNATTNAYTMVPNPTYGGPVKPRFAKLQALYFASAAAETNALRAGKLNFGVVHSSALPQVPVLRRIGYNVYGYPDLGFSFFVFNFADKTNNWDKIVGQLYIRQALAHLQDEDAIIKGVYHGAAAPAYGPIPAIPKTDYVPSNAATNPYPFSTQAAAQLLTSHGWKVVPNGTTTCQNAGSGPNQCGAGIPAGAKLDITMYYDSTTPATTQTATQLASAGKPVGINIKLVGKTFNYIIENYDNPSAPQNKNKWQMEIFGGFTTNVYPTTDLIFNTGGSFNTGSYSDKTADQLIKNSEFSSDPNAVRAEAQYLTQNLPGIFTENEDRVYAWKGISGPPDAFANVTQFTYTPEYWYLTK